MKKYIILILSFINCLQVFSQQATQEPELSSSLLWEISRSDIPHSSYIFGTNHIFLSSLIDTSSVVKGIIERVQIVIPEVDMLKTDTAGILELLRLKPNEYYSFENDEDEKRVSEYFTEKTGLPFFAYMQFKPILPLLTIIYLEANKVTNKSEDIDLGSGIDMYFQKEAKRLDKKIEPLEKPYEQIQILTDGLTVKEQTKMLVDYVKYPDYQTNGLEKIDSCYRSFDLDCIQKLEYSYYSKEKFRKLIFDDRNLKWVKILPAIINYKPSIIVVGAGHLPGKNGIIELLRAQGYSLKPVKFW